MAEQKYDLDFDGYWFEGGVRSIPDESGIYCVFGCERTRVDGKWQVSLKRIIYIGESANVRSRLTGHEKIEEWKKILRSGEVLCFSFAPISSANRVRCEAAMIFQHEPPVNTEYVEAFPHDKTTISTSGCNGLLARIFTVRRT